MLFLLNDQVLDLSMLALTPPMAAHRFRALTQTYIEQLGRELFCENPMLHREAPEQARRLASLIVTKTPQINGALFVPPSRGCPPSVVEVRYADLAIDVMGELFKRQREGTLTTLDADRLVWRRLAA